MNTNELLMPVSILGSLGAAIYFLHVLAKAKEEMLACRSEEETEDAN